MSILDIIPILKQASASDTCWPGCRERWTPENPAWGHCVMYVLYVDEFYVDISVKDSIVFMEAVLPNGDVVPHYCNHLNGADIDLSVSQFEEGTRFQSRKFVSREEILALLDNEKERYELFRARIVSLLQEG